MKNKLCKKIIKNLLILVMIISIITPAKAVFRNAVEIAAGNREISVMSSYNYYTVKPGDSLYLISQRFGTGVDRLKELNNLTSNLIYPGQRLRLSEENNSREVIYTVISGDSLYRISQKYNVSVAQIMEANNLSSYLIYPGQKLVIPVEKREEKEGYKRIEGQVIIDSRSWNNHFSSDISDENMPEEFNKAAEKTVLLSDYSHHPAYEDREIIIRYKPLISSQEVDRITAEDNLIQITQMEINEGRLARYQVPEGKNIEELVENYNKLENVEWAEPNYLYYPQAVPNDDLYRNYQWNLKSINLESAWEMETGDSSVTVAVIDTGVIKDHPDLQGNLIPGVDFVGGDRSYPVEDYSITDDDPTDESTINEGGSHGTHVAGIIGAVTNNNIGVAGVSWHVNLLPIRALTRTGGTSWDIAEAIYYAVDQGADIINLSLGGNHNSSLQHEAVKAAYEQGITIVAAAGNEGRSSVYYPAAYPETIAVSAVNQNNQRSSFSNYGPEIDLAAPGGDYGQPVYSTWGYYNAGTTISRYNGMIGTSMAAPHVSGTAALLAARGINDPEEIRSILTETAVNLGDSRQYGAGLIDAYAALKRTGSETVQGKVLVTAVEKDENTFYKKSEDLRIDAVLNKAVDFELEKVETDADYVIAWLDSNQNGIIDQGDYYGEFKLDDIDLEEKQEIKANYLLENPGIVIK